MEEVKDHLGHGSIRVTSDSYSHLFPSARLTLAESLETTFLGAVSAETDCETDERRTKFGKSAAGSPNRLKIGPLTWYVFGADDGIRTRDPHLGKVMLYQLSHVR